MGLTPLIPDPNAPPIPKVQPMVPAQVPQFGAPLLPFVTSSRNERENALESPLAPQIAQHPQGFWKNVRHIAARIGNVAGDIVAPAMTAMIPGSDLNKGLVHEANVRELAGLQSEDRADQTAASENTLRGAQANKTNAETTEVGPNAESNRVLQGAEATHLGAETNALENPAAEYEVHDTQDGPMVLNKRTGTGQHLSADGKPIGPKITTKTVQLEIGGKPHQVLVNDSDGSVIRDMGVSGEKPPSINIGNKEDAALKKQVYTAYTPVMDSAERFNVMSKNYEDAVKTHDQQAMLSLLYNHMGMTMGLQKGARMTQALIMEAQKSQPWLQGIKAKFDGDGYLTGVTLSPGQMQEMVHNAQGRYSEDAQKARNESRYLGANDDGPARTPNASTINYYLSLAIGI